MATDVLQQNTIGPGSAPPAPVSPTSSPGLNVGTSVVDLLKSKGMAADIGARTSLATSYGISGYTGTAAQNMALMALINKGGPTVDNSKISGSSSVIQDANANKAAAGAATGTGLVPSTSSRITTNTDGPKFVTNPDGTTTYQPAPGSTTTPFGVVGTPVTNADGSMTYTLTNGSTVTTTVDPTIAAAKNQVTTSFKDTMAQNTDVYQQELKQLQEEKATALSAAEAEYDKANPYGEGSDKQGYMSNISKQYDEQMANISTNFQAQNKTLTDSMNTQLASIDATAKSNANNAFNLQLKNLDGTDLTNNDMSTLLGLGITAGMSPAQATFAIQQSQGKAAIALNKTLSAQDRADRSQALNDFNTMVKGLTTPFDQLPDSVKSDLAQKAVDAGLSDNIEDGAKLVASENKGIIDEQAKQDKQQQDLINAQARLAIAQENSTRADQKFTYDKAITYVKSLDPGTVSNLKSLIQQSPSNPDAATQITDWIASRSNSLGADPTMLSNAIEDGLGLKPATVTTITSKPVLGGLFHSTTTSTKSTSDGSSGGSSSGGGTFTYGGVTYTY